MDRNCQLGFFTLSVPDLKVGSGIINFRKKKSSINIQMRSGVCLVIKDKVVHQRHVKDATSADDG